MVSDFGHNLPLCQTVILFVVFDCQAMTRKQQELAFLFAGGILFAVHAYGFSPLRLAIRRFTLRLPLLS